MGSTDVTGQAHAIVELSLHPAVLHPRLVICLQMNELADASLRAMFIGALSQAMADPCLPVAEEAAAVLIASASSAPSKSVLFPTL